MEELQESSIFPEREVNYASFGYRFGAAIIDGIIIAIPSFIVVRLCGEKDLVQSPITLEDGQLSFNFVGSLNLNLVSTYINTLITLTYSTLLTASPMQGTLGKRALLLRVTDLDNQTLTVPKAALRHLGKILSGVILYIGYFMMLWDKNKQTLHDKIAGSIVVR